MSRKNVYNKKLFSSFGYGNYFRIKNRNKNRKTVLLRQAKETGLDRCLSESSGFYF